MTSELGSDIIFEFFGYFGENLSNSISTPNFIMIEPETTKLGGRAMMHPMHSTTVVFLK